MTSQVRLMITSLLLDIFKDVIDENHLKTNEVNRATHCLYLPFQNNCYTIMRMYVENKVPMVFLFLIATLFEVLLMVSLFCCCSWKI